MDLRRRWKIKKKYANSICLIAGIIFFFVIVLFGNNFALYESYKKAYKEVEILSFSNSKIQLENTQLNASLEQLREENKTLKKSYFDMVDKNEKFENLLDEIKDKNDRVTLKNNELINRNNELLIKNKELAGDNIALQNSLKMAASVGVKPQNYTLFGGLEPKDVLERGQYIGKFSGTAYTPSIEECGNNKGITNSGKPIIPGISVAIDKNHWPFGTIFYIKGLGYVVAMDTGGSVKGKYRFDFAVFDKEFARILGARKWDVYLVKMGNGVVEDKTLISLGKYEEE